MIFLKLVVVHIIAWVLLFVAFVAVGAPPPMGIGYVVVFLTGGIAFSIGNDIQTRDRHRRQLGKFK